MKHFSLEFLVFFPDLPQVKWLEKQIQSGNVKYNIDTETFTIDGELETIFRLKFEKYDRS